LIGDPFACPRLKRSACNLKDRRRIARLSLGVGWFSTAEGNDAALLVASDVQCAREG